MNKLAHLRASVNKNPSSSTPSPPCIPSKTSTEVSSSSSSPSRAHSGRLPTPVLPKELLYDAIFHICSFVYSIGIYPPRYLCYVLWMSSSRRCQYKMKKKKQTEAEQMDSRSEYLFHTCFLCYQFGDVTPIHSNLECYYAVLRRPITEQFCFHSFAFMKQHCY